MLRYTYISSPVPKRLRGEVHRMEPDVAALLKDVK
jgi:hypothetical protein